eukprot:TRINITY_DN1689_c0_g1_i4.p1 TRINITY_DN1689_c0_g1~~TRINITY_DN1689_c0_g1_i4.p1  ORF type:complete len:333 (+),score=88.94 TRINITY_DN1689_c0_g1_i4:71-1000(+)
MAATVVAAASSATNTCAFGGHDRRRMHFPAHTAMAWPGWQHQLRNAEVQDRVKTLAPQHLKVLQKYTSVRWLASAAVEANQESSVTIDNSTVLVVGGGGLGMEVVRQLATAGSWVTAFQRGEKFRGEIEQLGAMLAIGDVMKPDTIEKALRSNTFDAVVCSVGGGIVDIKVDSEGVINLIDATKKAGVSRFVLVTSIGVGNSYESLTERSKEVLGPVLREKERAEEHLKASGLTWTIVRPGGLQSEPGTGNGVLTVDPRALGVISRADVAALILKLLFNEKSAGKVLAAVDSKKEYPFGPTVEFEQFVL